jgi:hypothetical protein
MFSGKALFKGATMALLASAIILFGNSAAMAEEAGVAPAAPKTFEERLAELEKKVTDKNTAAENSFAAYGFGFAMGAYNVRHVTAGMTNNVVRITNDSPWQSAPMLEMHRYGDSSKNEYCIKRNKNIGCGPFVVISSDSSLKSIPVIGAGIMFGYRIGEHTGTSTALNFGFGAVLDTQATELGDGITADAALPAGETEVRTKTVSKLGLLLIASFSF